MPDNNQQHKTPASGQATGGTGKRHQITLIGDDQLTSPVLRDSTYLHEVLNEGQLVALKVNAPEAVRMIQLGLRELYPEVDLGLGPEMGVDGIYGSKTKGAVKRFQKDYDLGVDGIVGPNTLRKLDTELAFQSPANPEVPADARELKPTPRNQPEEESQLDASPQPAGENPDVVPAAAPPGGGLEGAPGDDEHSKSFVVFKEVKEDELRHGWIRKRTETVKRSATPASVNAMGQTSVTLTIEFAEVGGKFKIGLIKVESVVELFTSEFQDIADYGPVYKLYTDKYHRNVEKFAKDIKARSFATEESTTRHELLHVVSYEVAVRELYYQYVDFLDTMKGRISSESDFKDQSEFFWSLLSSHIKDHVITHEKIHELDTQVTIGEYERRILKK